MTDEESAAILFAETREWRPDPSHPEQVRYARRALARGLLTSEGKGFLRRRWPTPTDFGNPESLAVWQDCLLAIRLGKMAIGSQTLSFYFGRNPPSGDSVLRKRAPALKDAITSEEFGPILVNGGGAPGKLYVYDGVKDTGPGFIRGAVEPTAKSNYFRNRLMATIIVLAWLALFGLISRFAF
ncbi:hypothetical protein ELH75_37030 [Rhizobium leguminosarum]|uniref:hypothetical protein n=1 Tax=Rhizobium leguminosarum TaxID=384 RepID=UPI001031E088|nr:hypothetical protein [Rhizobium leguminosarum]TAZ44114.1 hypothetical protein ELH75_37030 [Rhizobium leguminosarum]